MNGEIAQQAKPPIGLVPRSIWVDQRVAAIWEAIHRYTEAGRDIPAKWMAELREHMEDRP